MHPLGTLVRFIWRSGRRAAVMVVGLLLLAGGGVMIPLPGPGIVLIVAGLAVLATEFVWAERMLDQAKAHAVAATDLVPGGARLKSAARRAIPRRGRSTDAPAGDAPPTGGEPTATPTRVPPD